MTFAAAGDARAAPTRRGNALATLIVVWYTSALWFFQLVGEGL